MHEVDDPELLRAISVDFYLEGRSKVDIAKERGLSRFQVARMLTAARDLGIVTITVGDPASAGSARQTALAEALGVREVVVSRPAGAGSTARDNLARELARALVARTEERMTVGISWSRTIERAARHIDGLAPCDVVQLVGALPVEGSGDSLELIQHLKAIPGVRTWPIWSPLVLRDAATAAGLRQQPQIAAALAKADALDVAVVAVGGWSADSSTVYDTLTEADLGAALRGGVVGECSGRLFDAHGREVVTGLDDRVVGVRIDQLRRTPEVIVAGFGAAAAPALLAAVRGGFARTLVIDPGAAQALAALVPAESAD